MNLQGIDELVSPLPSEVQEKCENSDANWKPGSVQEWFEQNTRREKAQKKIKVCLGS